MPDLWAELHPGHTILPNPNLGSAYPKWIDAPQGRVIVHSRSEEQDAMAGQEIEPIAKPVNNLLQPPAMPEKTQLQLQAQELGINIDRRWGAKKLRAVIESHR